MNPTSRVSITASQAGENRQTNGSEHTIVSSILTDLHNILLDHNASEWTIVEDLEEVSLPAAKYSLAGSSNVTNFSYMSGPDNNIRKDKSEAESMLMILGASLIIPYKYAKLHGLLR